MNTDLYQYEKELWNKNINLVGGIDEVGRGPLIGPVVAACVILPKDFKLEGLTDSKKLSEKKLTLKLSKVQMIKISVIYKFQVSLVLQPRTNFLKH